MAERWQQWMPFHIDRWRGSAHVQAMRAAARAGYLYLLASAWQSEDGSLPEEEEELQVLAGLKEEEWLQDGARILRRFTRREDGRYVNEVLLAEWTAAKAVYDKRHRSFDEVRRVRSAAGKVGAERRWNRSASDRQERHNSNCIPEIGEIGNGSGTAEEISKADDGAVANDVRANGRAMANDSKPIASDRLQGQEQEQQQKRPGSCERPGSPASTAHAAPAGSAFLALPLLGCRTHIVTEADVTGYQQAYPAVDVRAELRKMLPWLDANPGRRSKTLQGSKQRIVKWLSRSQDRMQDWGGSRGSNQNSGDRRQQQGARSGGFQSRGQQRVEQALEELAKAGVLLTAERPEAGAGEVWVAEGRGDGRDPTGVVLPGYC